MSRKWVRKDADAMMGQRDEGEVEILGEEKRATPFISFHYSYQEISSVNGRTRVRSKKKQFVDGKFESEEFEGTLGGHVYEHMAYGLHRNFFRQIGALLKPFSVFFPFMPGDPKKNSK